MQKGGLTGKRTLQRKDGLKRTGRGREILIKTSTVERKYDARGPAKEEK